MVLKLFIKQILDTFASLTLSHLPSSNFSLLKFTFIALRRFNNPSNLYYKQKC